jgi:hypothetical protein
VEAEVRGQRGREVGGRGGARLPAGEGLGEGGALEQGGGAGEGVGEEAEGGGEGGGVLRASGDEAEEVDGLGEVAVEGVKGVDVDGVGLREGESLGGDGPELNVEGLLPEAQM